jgi:SPP1 gp7 family putative phage head morphogenesis protein
MARKRRPPVPAAKPPKAILWRAEYTRRLVYLHKAFAEHVIDHAKATLGQRTDAVQDDLLDMFGPLIESLGLSKFLKRMGHSITKAQANYLKRVANVTVSGVAPAAKLEAWRQQNLSLIRSLGAEQVQQIGDILRPAQNMGLRWEDVADEIQARLDVGESRARLIARDQTNKWNGAMQQQTQSDAGITSYKWLTAGDQAVRGRPGGVYAKSKENHWDLQGTIQKWSDPPLIPGTDERSHPGQRIQCRCSALPIVPWLEDA